MNKDIKGQIRVANKKAGFLYNLIKKYSTGIILRGTEVKAIRMGKVSINEAFCYFKKSELYVKNMSISKYREATFQNHEEMRDRKILLTKKEISKISKLTEVRGITMIPLEMFTVRGRFKLKVGVCKGKKDYDKRNSIKERDNDRELRRKDF
jgi:SsrA-binding protein